ncbi:MAG: hypothetical protein Q7T33_04555 [Dehalococcoidia bacterium]|nr:hypothetical protein [Dehalococcoidia bacterium]
MQPSEETSDFLEMDSPLAGYWFKPDAGFEWARPGVPVYDERGQPVPDKGPWLVPRGDTGTRYAVLRRSRLLPAFADLGRNASPERVLTFANEWGPLGQGECNVGKRSGASLNTWGAHARKVATLCHLWEWVRLGDTERLEPYIRWQSRPAMVSIALVSVNGLPDAGRSARMTGVGALPPNSWGPVYTLASASHDPNGFLRQWEHGDPVEPMRYYVCQSVNQALEGHINRAVLPYYGYAVRYFPDSLLSAVYLRLQDRIAGAVRQERQCTAPGCPQGRFIPGRSDQQYCSNLCRKRAHYHAQKEGKSDGR